MSNRSKRLRSASAPSSRPARPAPAKRKPLAALLGAVALAIACGAWLWNARLGQTRTATTPPAVPALGLTNAPGVSNLASNSYEVAQAVMVTVELDFGEKPPTIREALREIERRSEATGSRERTFAILDAYGEPTADGKLHLSMHVSMEKPGLGFLIFRRTGEVLWKAQIVPAKSGTHGEKNLTIMMEDGTGKQLLLDGSKGAQSVLDIPFRDSATLVRDLFPEGQEREFIFTYSVCGCPVKAKVRRVGEGTVRAGELPVMFPDDPAALAVIHQLMGWPMEL